MHLGPECRAMRLRLRALEWVVLEEVALDSVLDPAGRAIARTSARRIAANLGVDPGTVARALTHLRSEGLIERWRAQVEAARARGAVSEARVAASAAAAALDDARRRHWGRRDREAVDSATRRSEQAEAKLSAAIDYESKCRRVVKTEAAAQRPRLQALRDNRAILADLEQSVADVDRALERVRTDRVIAMERGDAPRSHVVAMLGEPPPSIAGRQAWCALAYEIETYRDHHPNAIGHEHEEGAQAAMGPSPSSLRDRVPWDHLTQRVANGAGIVAVADALPVEEHPALAGRSAGPSVSTTRSRSGAQ